MLSWRTRLERVKLQLSNDYLHGNRHHIKMRQKRGLFNFLGVFANKLMGVATSAEVRKTRELLRKVNNNNNAVNHIVHELATVVNQSRVYIKRNRDKINSLVAVTNNLLESIKRFAGGMQQTVNQNMQKHQAERLVEDTEVLADAFVDQVDQYHRQRAALELGVLTEDLLSVPTLSDILEHAKANRILNIEWYYQNVPVKPMWGEENIVVFQIELPLVKPIRYLQYLLETFPVPQEDGTVSTLKVNSGIAMENATGALLIPHQCRGHGPTVCGPAPLRSGEAMACERGILNNNANERQKCVVKLEKTSQVDEIWFVGENQIVLSTWGDTIYQKCQGRPELRGKLDQGVYTLNLTERCVYSGSTWHVGHTPTYTQHVHIKQEPLLDIPPVNIPAFVNTTGWKIHGLTELGEVKQFTLKTLGTFQKVNIPLSEEGWFWGTLIVILIVIAILILFVYYLKCYYFAAKGKPAEANDVGSPQEEPMEIEITEGSDPSSSSMECSDNKPEPSIASKEQTLKFLFTGLKSLPKKVP